MHLFRAVCEAERADLEAHGSLRTPEGIETKYFCASRHAAERYARMAMKAFGDGPYYLVEAELDDGLIGDCAEVIVDGGIAVYNVGQFLLSKFVRPRLVGNIEES